MSRLVFNTLVLMGWMASVSSTLFVLLFSPRFVQIAIASPTRWFIACLAWSIIVAAMTVKIFEGYTVTREAHDGKAIR